MPSVAISLSLSGSVGQGGKNNPQDVMAVKNRLADLGFPIARDSTVNSNTVSIIKLFQSIIKGKTVVAGDGRIDVDGPTHKFLQAANAPQWREMPNGSRAEGFINFDHEQGGNHDFGVSWMVETIQAAGQIYLTHLSSHPNAALIQTNDLSKPQGGDTGEHATHETGLSCDIRLPRKDGKAGGGVIFSDPRFDRDAMRAMLKAIRGQTKYKIDRIFFNDDQLIKEGLCKHAARHDNHVHIDISPPTIDA
jgi:hypothetical protein